MNELNVLHHFMALAGIQERTFLSQVSVVSPCKNLEEFIEKSENISIIKKAENILGLTSAGNLRKALRRIADDDPGVLIKKDKKYTAIENIKKRLSERFDSDGLEMSSVLMDLLNTSLQLNDFKCYNFLPRREEEWFIREGVKFKIPFGLWYLAYKEYEEEQVVLYIQKGKKGVFVSHKGEVKEFPFEKWVDACKCALEYCKKIELKKANAYVKTEY